MRITQLSCIIIIGQTSLTALADTEYTWLSENSPNSLCCMALSIEAYIFMKGEPDIICSYMNLDLAESLSRLKDLGRG
jgi:hypothetical protein